MLSLVQCLVYNKPSMNSNSLLPFSFLGLWNFPIERDLRSHLTRIVHFMNYETEVHRANLSFYL